MPEDVSLHQMACRQRSHLEAWQQEHLYPTLPGMASAEPSVSVLKLVAFAAQQGLFLGPHVLDIGCGKGRNALFFAQRGFRVRAFDLVGEAISVLKERAQAAGLAIDACIGTMDASWPYADDTFDVLIDDTASMSIGDWEGITLCRSEMARVVKPGGYAVIYSLAEDDPFLQSFLTGGNNIVVTPDGKRETLFSLEDLQTISGFQFIHQECWTNVGVTQRRKTVWTLLQKQDEEARAKAQFLSEK